MEHDIVGLNEIATMAGVTPQAVANWRARTADFPLPLSMLASGPVFRRSQVRAWLKRNNRKLDELQDTPKFYERLKSFRNDFLDSISVICRPLKYVQIAKIP